MNPLIDVGNTLEEMLHELSAEKRGEVIAYVKRMVLTSYQNGRKSGRDSGRKSTVRHRR